MGQDEISILLNRLKASGQLPANLQKSEFESVYFFNCFNEKRSSIVSYGVSTGVSEIESVAVMKALVEWIERLAFHEGASKGILACQTENSDGFAAYPYFRSNGLNFATNLARKHAYTEALERYCWATWWDKRTQAVVDFKVKPRSKPSLDLLKLVNSYTPLNHLIAIIPVVEGLSEFKTIILFGELKSGGYISGGAAGNVGDDEQIIFRALSEMARHSIGLNKTMNQNLLATTLYEERLLFFGLGQGNSLVTERLENSSSTPMVLPDLKFDVSINHSFADVVVVHRCLFDNQPPFVGGDLGRLCI